MNDTVTAAALDADCGAGPETVEGASDRSWAHLDRLKVGRYGEYFAKMALVRAGLDVYAPEVDDKAIDFVIRIPSSPPRYLDVQVKTARGLTGYVFMRKRHFTIEANRYLALVLLAEDAEPELYLIPATAWLSRSRPSPRATTRASSRARVRADAVARGDAAAAAVQVPGPAGACDGKGGFCRPRRPRCGAIADRQLIPSQRTHPAWAHPAPQGRPGQVSSKRLGPSPPRSSCGRP